MYHNKIYYLFNKYFAGNMGFMGFSQCLHCMSSTAITTMIDKIA